MLQENLIIAWNRPVAAEYRHMGLAADTGFDDAVPGQFVTLRAQDQDTPLLRRPFSIHRLTVTGGRVTGIEILYRVVGPCTRRFAQLQAGETVNVLGPLGKGFSLPAGCRRVFLVGGGIGVAPLLFLADRFSSTGIDPAGSALFLGGRTEADLLCRPAFRALGLPVHLSTDDGSVGHHGVITELIEKKLNTDRPDLICACGPPAMLAAIGEIAAKRSIPCQVSIETLMACGLGVCLGCAVDTVDADTGYHHTCKDGPVFDARRLKWC